ncbi:unnamed protein product, partial [Adineta steineri]
QDTFAFNILQGYWERLNFPNPPKTYKPLPGELANPIPYRLDGGFGKFNRSQ